MSNGEQVQVGLRHYLRICWRRRWLIALAFAVGAGSALFLSSRKTPVYVATAKIFIGPRTVERTDLSAVLEELNFSGEFVSSYVELLKSRPLAQKVIENEGLRIAPTALAGSISTRIVPDTRIIEVSLKGSDPGVAEHTVNSLVRTFVEDVQKDFGGRAGAQASVLEPALRPGSPVGPQPSRDGALGAVFGLMVGVGVAFLLEQADTRLRSREDVETALAPLPLLAAIPSAPSGDGALQIHVEEGAKSSAAEAFRILRTNVQFLGVDRPVRTVLVTSAYAEDGKTTVAVNLAAAMAAVGLRTLIMESDLRRPMVHEYFSIPQSPGITDVLVGRIDLARAIRPTKFPGLMVLPAGALPPNPAELLGSRRAAEVLDRVRGMAEVVVLDSPPALPVADAIVLAPLVDGVILVVRSGRTHRERAREVAATFARMQVRVLGTVLNDVEPHTGYGYGYYHRYYHRYYAEGNGRVTEPATATQDVKILASPLPAAAATGQVTSRWEAPPAELGEESRLIEMEPLEARSTERVSPQGGEEGGGEP